MLRDVHKNLSVVLIGNESVCEELNISSQKTSKWKLGLNLDMTFYFEF